MYKIIDNFLDSTVCDILHDKIISSDWKYCENIVSTVKTNNYQFINYAYGEGEPKSFLYNDLNASGFLFQMKASALIKIKANFQPATIEIVENPLHIDHKFPNALTAIYYVNTNNGYTFFENGDKVQSVKNRMVIFPSNIKHAGTTCTDEKYRCVLNLNYYPQSSFEI